MSDLGSGSELVFSIGAALVLGLVMVFDSFKRVFDEDGSLYEVEYRSASARSQALTRLASSVPILFIAVVLTQEEPFWPGKTVLFSLLLLFLLAYALSYSRDQNFTSLYFKETGIRQGFRLWTYEEVHLVVGPRTVELVRTRDGKGLCSFPRRSLHFEEFRDFVETCGFSERIQYTIREATERPTG